MKPNRLKYAITFFAIVIIIPSVIAWDLSSDGVTTTVPDQTRIATLIKYDDGSGNGAELYGGSYPGGYLLKYKGLQAYAKDTVILFGTPVGWDLVATTLNAQTGIMSTVIYEGDIYAGTYPGGRLFHYTPGAGWSQVAAQLNSQTYINALTVLMTAPGKRFSVRRMMVLLAGEGGYSNTTQQQEVGYR